MASIDLQVITQELNRRFAAPLPEFYKRRIIFWYDEDREFEEKIDELELSGAIVVKLTGTNTFAVKKLLCHDDLSSNFLVYRPFSFDRDDDNWLINIELYSEEFRADLCSIWMDEMGMPKSPALRKLIQKYRKFFNAKERRVKLAALEKIISTTQQLQLAVMAVICGINAPHLNSIIRAVLKAGLDASTNAVYQSLVNYGADETFWKMIDKATGYQIDGQGDLGRLAIHVLLTATTRTMRGEFLAGMERFISIPHQAFCYDFVSDWMYSDDIEALYHIARYSENETKLPQRFMKLGISELVDTACFPCINEIILMQLMTEIGNHIIQVDTITSTVEKRRTMAWYEYLSCYYDGILLVARMQEFFLQHSGSFHTVEPMKLWQEYTEDYYHMDTYYRQFHSCFSRCLKCSNMLLDDLFKQVVSLVEGLYTVWFLGGLGSNWTTAAADALEKAGRFDGIPAQEDFYSRMVKPTDTKVYVIISDALRYEVAASLYEQLQRETQSKVELTSQSCIFPTITSFGMAALLPHHKLTVQEKAAGGLSVLADGMSTESQNRDKVLKATNPLSIALQYTNIIGMKRADRQVLVKGMDVVYIYHDKIDESAHTSDSAAFPACEDAIFEIMNLVRIIINEFGGTHILITADHGFLYTHSPLSEDNKLGKESWDDNDIDYGRRYAILKAGAKPEYLMPVRLLDGESEYKAYAPRENIRIKMNGGGLNFVHGGVSLQEMVVPVIDFRFIRNQYREYQRNRELYDTKPVTIKLLSSGRKISNMIFSLSFFQNEAIGPNRTAATYLVYFVDSAGRSVSDTAKIIADKTSNDVQERSFQCSFNLKSLQFDNKETYYLIIADETGMQMPEHEAFTFDIAFAVDEFNFF